MKKYKKKFRFVIEGIARELYSENILTAVNVIIKQYPEVKELTISEIYLTEVNE